MGAIASQTTSLTIVYSIVYSGADQRKHQSFASLAFVRGIHRGPVNSPHTGPVTRKMFPFDDVIMVRYARCVMQTRMRLEAKWKTRVTHTQYMAFQTPFLLYLYAFQTIRNTFLNCLPRLERHISNISSQHHICHSSQWHIRYMSWYIWVIYVSDIKYIYIYMHVLFTIVSPGQQLLWNWTDGSLSCS